MSNDGFERMMKLFAREALFRGSVSESEFLEAAWTALLDEWDDVKLPMRFETIHAADTGEMSKQLTKILASVLAGELQLRSHRRRAFREACVVEKEGAGNDDSSTDE